MLSKLREACTGLFARRGGDNDEPQMDENLHAPRLKPVFVDYREVRCKSSS
jgi:hypothetical protein